MVSPFHPNIFCRFVGARSAGVGDGEDIITVIPTITITVIIIIITITIIIIIIIVIIIGFFGFFRKPFGFGSAALSDYKNCCTE